MARVRIDLPAHFPFTTEMTVCFSHINPGNHVDNVQLLNFVTEARVRFLRWLGYTERDIEGYSMPVGDLSVQYLAESFYGETLCVAMTVADFNKYGFDAVFRIDEKITGRAIARGKLGLVFLDKLTRKVAPVPLAFLERLRQHQI